MNFISKRLKLFYVGIFAASIKNAWFIFTELIHPEDGQFPIADSNVTYRSLLKAFAQANIKNPRELFRIENGAERLKSTIYHNKISERQSLM